MSVLAQRAPSRWANAATLAVARISTARALHRHAATIVQKLVPRAAIAACGLSAVLALARCVRDPAPEDVVGELTVITQFDPQARFDTLKTFAISDTIALVTQLDAAATATVDPAIAGPSIAAIEQELVARGHTRVTLAEQPDMGVVATAVIRPKESIQVGSWWGFGAAAGGFWGYTGAPFVTGITFSAPQLWVSGALVIELYDLRDAREALRTFDGGVDAGAARAAIRVVWEAFIYGVIAAGGQSVRAPPIEGIHQAFVQSPYLDLPVEIP